MSANEERVREFITQEAADWFLENREGLTAKERYRFIAWLKASPRHVEEYLALAAVAGDLREACEVSQDSLDELLARARLEENPAVRSLRPNFSPHVASVASVRWRGAAVAMACSAVVGTVLLAWWPFRPLAPVAPPADVALHFQTGHGEQQTRRLADNSVLHLNTDSQIIIRYSNKERLLVLNSGEADFEVSHDVERPFRVFAGSAEVVAIGTKFDVRLERGATLVTVVQGRVAVGPPAMSDRRTSIADLDHAPGFVQLVADQQVSVIDGRQPTGPVGVDAQRATAWLHRKIVFDHESLERVASEFNRYAATPFEIITPALRSLEISGVFATDDTEAFIAFLRSLKGVRVEETATQVRVSQD